MRLGCAITGLAASAVFATSLLLSPSWQASVGLTVPSAAAQDLPRLAVRAGAHDIFTRLVFDWPEQVPYQVSQDGGLVTLVFDRAVAADLRGINRNPPLFVGGALTQVAGGKTYVLVAIPPQSQIKHFVSRNRVVLDIQEPAEWQDPVALPAKIDVPEEAVADNEDPKQPAETATDGALETSTIETTGAAAISAPATSEVAPAPAPAPAPLAQPVAPVSETILAAPEAPSTRPSQVAQAGGGLTPPAPSPQSPAAATQPSGPVSLLPGGGTTDPNPNPAAPTPAPAPAAETRATGNAPANAPAIANSDSPAGPRPADLAEGEQAPDAQTQFTGGEDLVTLRFDWDEPVAAAVFRRASNLYVVFDKRTNVNLPALTAAAGELFTEVEQIRIPEATVLRFRAGPGLNPGIRRDGLAWILDFVKQPLAPQTPLEIQSQPNSPIGARLFIPMPEPGKVIGLTDPIIGDNIVVVPGIPLGHGIAQSYMYPQFEMPPTAQGVVIAPRIDNLRVRGLRQGVEISSSAPTSPLALSSVSDEMAAAARISSLRPLGKILDLEKWETPDDAAIQRDRSVLEEAIASAPPLTRQDARLNLGRFYIANAYGAEGLGVLSLALSEQPDLIENPEFLMLRAIGAWLMGRSDEAAQDLARPLLAENDEAEFWRAVTEVDLGQGALAAAELNRSGSLTRAYPRPLRLRLGVYVADAAVELGDTAEAETLIAVLLAERPGPNMEAEIQYVQGRLGEVAGDFDGAIDLWEEVMEGPNRFARFKAGVARAELITKLQRADRAGIIQAWEDLRFAWRGDEREFDLLRRLGGLYLDFGVYRQGLQTLRQAATHFRDHPDAKQITQQMSDVFRDLYLNDVADNMSPVTAIAVYEEFRELTPAGNQGDLMIQKLAERLVGVDLLDNAARLLEGQIRFRLQGTDKARVGLQLALIHNIAGKPGDAERVLRATAEAGIPPALQAERQRMLARTLMGQNKDLDALALIEADESLQADLIRSELHWLNAEWVESAQALQRVVRASGARKDEPVDQQQAKYVMSLVTAMTLAGNERGLARIRDSFRRAMATTAYADAFNLISTRPAVGIVAPSSVQERVEQAQKFQTFMASYLELLQSDPSNALEFEPPAVEQAEETGGADTAEAPQPQA